jgi:hypothetical protein
VAVIVDSTGFAETVLWLDQMTTVSLRLPKDEPRLIRPRATPHGMICRLKFD